MIEIYAWMDYAWIRSLKDFRNLLYDSFLCDHKIYIHFGPRIKYEIKY